MGINILGTKQCTPSGWPFFVLKLYSPLHFQDYDEIWNSVSLFLPSDSFLYFYDKEYGSEREMQTRHSYIDRAFRHSHLRCWCVPEDRKAATGIDKFSKGGTLHPLLAQRNTTEFVCYDCLSSLPVWVFSYSWHLRETLTERQRERERERGGVGERESSIVLFWKCVCYYKQVNARVRVFVWAYVSVQFSVVSKCSEKPTCAPSLLSEVSPLLLLKKFQC